jgi:hypothetical protein
VDSSPKIAKHVAPLDYLNNAATYGSAQLSDPVYKKMLYNSMNQTVNIFDQKRIGQVRHLPGLARHGEIKAL